MGDDQKPGSESEKPKRLVAAVRKASREANPDTEAPPATDKPRVLVIDDSVFSQSMVTRALDGEFEVIKANDGAEGLAVLTQEPVDLVVTDLLMPKISGLAFLGAVRKRFEGIKVIVCSADVQDSTAAKVKSLGAAAFLSKPVEPEELRRVARLVISQDVLPREIEISPEHADAFKEIFSIGVGRAAKALSKLVYEEIKLSIPNLQIIRPSRLSAYVWGTFKGSIASVRQDFTGTADGSAYLLMSAPSGRSFVNSLVTHESESPDTEMNQADQQMMAEVGNILINSLVGSLGNTLGIHFDLKQPTCSIGGPEIVYDHLELRDSDYVLFLETLFVVPGRQVGGTLVILLGSAGMGRLIKSLDELL